MFTYWVLDGSRFEAAGRAAARWAYRRIQHARISRDLNMRRMQPFYQPLLILLVTYLVFVFVVARTVPDGLGAWFLLEFTKPFSPWWLGSLYSLWLWWWLVTNKPRGVTL